MVKKIWGSKYIFLVYKERNWYIWGIIVIIIRNGVYLVYIF